MSTKEALMDWRWHATALLKSAIWVIIFAVVAWLMGFDLTYKLFLLGVIGTFVSTILDLIWPRGQHAPTPKEG